MIDTVPSLGCGFLHDHQTNSPDRTGGGGKTRTQSVVGSMNNLQQFRKSSMDLVCWSGAQQDAVWNPEHVANQLHSLLREYYAAFLEALPGSSRWTGVSGCLCCPGDRLDSDASCPAHLLSAECCPTTRRPTARGKLPAFGCSFRGVGARLVRSSTRRYRLRAVLRPRSVVPDSDRMAPARGALQRQRIGAPSFRN